MNQIYHDSVQLALNTQILVPLALDCRHLKQAFMDIMDAQDQNDDIQDYITQETFDLINQKVIKILVDALEILKQHLFLGWTVNGNYIQEIAFDYIDDQTKNWVNPRFFCNRMNEVKVLIQSYYKKCQDNAFELAEALVSELCDDYLGNQQLEEQLNELLEAQEKSWAYDFFEFAYLEVEITLPLLNKMQEIFKSIVEDFFLYIVDVAQYANEKMCRLNELLEKHNSLANSENYKYMQKEISQKIIQYGDEAVIGKSFNRNPQKQDRISRQAIKYFYEILDNNIYRQWIHLKNHINLEELLNSAEFTIIRPLPQNFQVIHNSDDIHLMELCSEIYVVMAQKVQKNGVQGYKITIKYNNQKYDYIISLSYHYLMFHQNYDGWEQFEEQNDINIMLVKFLNKNFDYLHSGHPEFKKKITSEKSVEKTLDEIQEFKNTVFKFKKFSAPKKPIRYGTRARVIGAKALGMGLGCLIVDCLDDDIPWEDKMKNAGYTVVSFGVLAVLAARLPVIGIIIQQVILAFAIKSVLANKVINDSQTAKNLGHLSLVIAIGLGLTIAGSIMFPVALWGAFFGGLLGGVGMGLYQKYMIPYCMENLVLMMNKASQLIRRNGVVRYKPFALEKLQFDQKFFVTKKPSNLTDDDFFTLLMFCLSNEVKLISVVFYEKQKEKLIKNKATEVELADLLDRQCQIEVQLKVWNDIKEYLQARNVSLVQNADTCAEFVDGMLSNFKVQ